MDTRRGADAGGGDGYKERDEQKGGGGADTGGGLGERTFRLADRDVRSGSSRHLRLFGRNTIFVS